MARRDHDPGTAVSLFPFMSILTCVIGVLTLLLGGTLIGQLSASDVARIEEWRELSRALARSLGGADALEEEIASLADIQRQLDEARRRCQQAEQTLSRPASELRAQHEQVAAYGKLLEEVERLEHENAALERYIDAANAPQVESIRIVAGERGDKVIPCVVECTGDGLVIHPSKTRIAVKQYVHEASLKSLCADPEFIKEVVSVGKLPSHSVLLIVRNTGVKTYSLARRALVASNVTRFAALPLPHDGPVDIGALGLH